MITDKILRYYHKRLDGHLFPLDGKIPALKGNWRKRKFTKSQIKDFVERGYNIGWAIGQEYLVIDVDPRNGGLKSLKKLRNKLGLGDLSSSYPTVITGSGGFHYYMKLPKLVSSKDLRGNHKKYPGIDIKKKGGYVVIAGSLHPETEDTYKFDTSSPLDKKVDVAPKPLVKKFKKQIKAAIEGEAKTISCKSLKRLLSKLPVEEYNTNDTWFPILASSHSATSGKGLKEFVEWSTQDSKYKDSAGEIEARWNSFRNRGKTITIQTLLAEVLKHDNLQNLTSKKEAKKEFDDEVSVKKKKRKKELPALPEQLISDHSYVVAMNVLNGQFEGGKTLIHGPDLRYWQYNGKYWEPVQVNMVEKYLYEETIRYKLTHPHVKKAVSNIFKTAESILRAVTASHLQMFKYEFEKTIINTENKELWLDDKTGDVETKEHSPESALTYCLETKYNKKADCPRFKVALQEIFRNQKDAVDISRHLFEVIGYSIQAKKNIATWVLFHGKGSNGKTVILQIISALLGEAALEKSVDELHTGRNNHALADLPGKLAIIDEDVNAFTTLPDGAIKKVSENKTLVANPKGAATFRFRNAAIPLLAANNWPSTKDLSEGLRRRALVFHFTRQFSPKESDIGLADYIIENELDGVLNEALRGLKRLRKRGRFEIPESCQQAKDMWFLSNSQIHQFMSDAFTKERGKKVAFSKVWQKYMTWCQDNGIRMHMAKHRLRQVMTDIGIRIEYTKGRRLTVYGYKEA